MTATRFSITMPLANSLGRPDHELYAEIGTRYRAAEELGYDTVFNLEHHFTDFIVCPDAMLLHAYVAAITERIRLSTAVVVAPWHNPIRLAEQIAMVDLLSNGRVFPGLGRGTAIREHEAFGIDPETTRDRFAETVDVLRLALKGGTFSYEGPFHRYEDIELRPRPARTEIPMVGAAISPSTVEILAGMGLHLMMSGVAAPPAEVVGALASYEAAAVANGMNLDETEMIFHGLAWVADTDEQAFEEMVPVLPAFFDVAARHYEFEKNRWRGVKSYEYQAEGAEHGAFGSMDGDPMAIMRRWAGQQLVGSPETVARRIRHFVDAGFNHVSFYCEWNGTIPVERQVEFYRRLMTDVIPLVPEVEAWEFPVVDPTPSIPT